jgi:hypothetical protein
LLAAAVTPPGSTLAASTPGAALADDAAVAAAPEAESNCAKSALKLVRKVSVQQVRSVARVGSPPAVESVTDVTIG